MRSHPRPDIRLPSTSTSLSLYTATRFSLLSVSSEKILFLAFLDLVKASSTAEIDFGKNKTKSHCSAH